MSNSVVNHKVSVVTQTGRCCYCQTDRRSVVAQTGGCYCQTDRRSVVSDNQIGEMLLVMNRQVKCY